MSEEARKKLESGEWHWVLASDGSGMLPSMKDAAEHFAGQIRVGQKTIHPDVINSLIGLTQKIILMHLQTRLFISQILWNEYPPASITIGSQCFMAQDKCTLKQWV